MHSEKRIYERYIKRILDIILALIILTLFWWLILIIAILVKIKLGSPIVFKQPRPGKNEKIFNMYKFRTMTDERDANGELLPDEERLTSFGKFLRKTSCDELLEIFNILKGDMSFIGPRPLLVKYLERYNAEQHHRHDVRPGLTGYAQVHGRNAIGWEEKFALDLEYVKNITFLGDVKIFFDTVKVVLKRDGISSATAATMEEFMGTEKK